MENINYKPNGKAHEIQAEIIHALDENHPLWDSLLSINKVPRNSVHYEFYKALIQRIEPKSLFIILNLIHDMHLEGVRSFGEDYYD